MPAIMIESIPQIFDRNLEALANISILASEIFDVDISATIVKSAVIKQNDLYVAGCAVSVDTAPVIVQVLALPDKTSLDIKEILTALASVIANEYKIDSRRVNIDYRTSGYGCLYMNGVVI